MARKNSFKKSKITKVKLPTTGAWLTNVGKSFGLSAMDIIKDAIPATSEIISDAAEYASDFKTHMEELRSQRARMTQAMDKSVYMDIIRDAKKNAIEDFKKGNFYTPISHDDGYGDDDFDFEDFDVGDDSDYDADFESADGMTSISTSHSSKGDVDVNRVNVKVDMDKVTDAINRQTQVSIDTSNIALEYDKAFNKNLLAEISSANKNTASILGSIDSNVSTIVSTNQTIAQSATIAMKYYDDSMAVFNSINESLTAIRTSMTESRSMVGDRSRFDGKYNNIVDDIFSANGVLDLKAYSDVVGKQLKSAAANNLIVSQLLNIASDTDTLSSMFKHPLNLITEGLMKKVIPQMAVEAAQAFDQTLQESMITGLHRVRGLKNSTNPFLQFIGEAFGIGNKLKSDVDKSNYNKGKMDWNGESHKTLNEVIPYYLRRIAAAVTGTQEMVFDYNTGKFNTLSEVRSKYKEDDERVLLRELSGTISDMKDIINKNTTFANPQDKAEVEKSIKKMMSNFVKTDGTSAKRVNGSFLQFVADNMANGNTNDVTAQLIAGALDSLSNAQVTSLFGRDILNARNTYSKHKISEELGETPTNVRYVDDGLSTANEFLKEGRTKGSFAGSNYKVSPFIEKDKYGKSPNRYLRDIYELLLGGIITYPQFEVRDGIVRAISSNDGALNRIAQIRTKLSDDYEDGYRPSESHTGIRSQESFDRDVARGRVGVSSLNGSGDGLATQIKLANQQIEEGENRKDNTSWFSRFTGINDDQPITKIMNKFTEYIQKPGQVVADLFKKADDFVFKLVFSDYDKESGSMFKKAMAYVRVEFTKFSTWLNDRIFKPLEEHLFGEDGIFTKFKQSQFMQDFKAKMGNIGEFILGTKDADGNRTGGLLSETANALSDFGRQTKEYLVGKNEDSVLSNIKQVGNAITDEVLGIFGTSKEDIKAKKASGNYHPIKDAMFDIGLKFKMAGNMALDSIFGAGAGSGKAEEYKEGLKKDFESMNKGKWGAGAVLGAVGIPFIAAHSGLIGSFFLPGGPIGGALLGMGVAFASHSDTVMDFLFGKISDEGVREGGIVNKQLSNAFMNNSKGLVVGGLAGLAGSVGLLPAFFFPGGPIGGALVGMATSMAFKSETMQKFLFGEMDETTGKRDGSGILGKMQSVFKNAAGVTDKGRFLDVGVGAGLGVVGSFFLPGGPIAGALLGAAAGFAAGSEKFQTFLFGEEGSDGKRSGGVITRLTKKVSDVIMPGIKEAQIRLLGFLERGIMIPLISGFKPIINMGTNIVKNIADKASNMFKFIGNGIKEFLVGDKAKGKSGILSPLLGIGKFMAKAVTGVSRAIISAPFKLIEAVGKTLDLGSRLRNLLSPLIDGVIGGTLKLLKFGITKVTSALTNAIKNMILAPFRAIKSLTTGITNLLLGKKDKESGVRNGGLAGLFRNSMIGKAAGNAVGKFNVWRNKSKSSGNTIAGIIASGGTTRGKWIVDENGRPRFVKDENYNWNPTGNRKLTVGQESKNMKAESSAWENFNLAAGKGKGAEKARRQLEKLYGPAKVKEMLDNRDELLKDRSKFATSIGLGNGLKQTKVADAATVAKEQSINAKHVIQQEVEAYNVVVREMKVEKSNLDNLDNQHKDITSNIKNAKLDIGKHSKELAELIAAREKETDSAKIEELDNAIKDKQNIIEGLTIKSNNLISQGQELKKQRMGLYGRISSTSKKLKSRRAAVRRKGEEVIASAPDTELGNQWKQTVSDTVENAINPNKIEGALAKGSKGVPKTGLYLLSKHEQVIPNDPEQQKIDERNEAEFMSKHLSKNGNRGIANIPVLGNYAEGTNDDIELPTRFINKWKNVEDTILHPVRAFKSRAKAGVHAFVKNEKEDLVDAIHGMKDAMVDTISDIRSDLKPVAQSAKENLKVTKQKSKSLLEKTKEKASNIATRIKKSIDENPLIGKVSTFLFGKTIFGDHDNDIPETKVFKKYGVLGGMWKFMFGNDKADSDSYASKGIFGKVIKAISDFANETTIGRIIKTVFKVAVGGAVLGLATKFWKESLWPTIKEVAGPIITSVKNWWVETAWPNIKAGGSWLWEKINGGLGSILGEERWNTIKSFFTETIPEKFNDIKTMFTNPDEKEHPLMFKVHKFFEEFNKSIRGEYESPDGEKGGVGLFLKNSVVTPLWNTLKDAFTTGWAETNETYIKPIMNVLGETLTKWYIDKTDVTQWQNDLVEEKLKDGTIATEYKNYKIAEKSTGNVISQGDSILSTSPEYKKYANNPNYVITYTDSTNQTTTTIGSPEFSDSYANATIRKPEDRWSIWDYEGDHFVFFNYASPDSSLIVPIYVFRAYKDPKKIKKMLDDIGVPKTREKDNDIAPSKPGYSYIEGKYMESIAQKINSDYMRKGFFDAISTYSLQNSNGEPITLEEAVKKISDYNNKTKTGNYYTIPSNADSQQLFSNDDLKNYIEYDKWNKPHHTKVIYGVTTSHVSDSGASHSGGSNRSGDGGGHGFGDVPSFKNGFPYYSQNDPSIKNEYFGLSKGYAPDGIPETMGVRGCGPTALAMVASKIKGGYGNPYTPENMAKLAQAGNYSTNKGTSPNYFTEVGTSLGMNVTPAMATSDNILSMLNSGRPVIIQGQSNDKSSPFTSAGHYVVGVGTDKNGNILINDPRGKGKSKAYSIDKVADDAGAMWGFSGGFGPGGIGTYTSNVPEHAKLQIKLADIMRTIAGKLKYAQDNYKYPGSRNPDVLNSDGTRSGDCSSTVQWAYKKILGVDPGSTTQAQRNDSDMFTVASGEKATTNESILQIGDLLLDDKTGVDGRYKGHVEMYIGNGKMIGHGGPGKGPTIKDLNQSGDYDLVRRWIGFMDGAPTNIITPPPEPGAWYNSGENNYNLSSDLSFDDPTTNNTTNKKSSSSSLLDVFGRLVSAIRKPVSKFLFGESADEEVIGDNGYDDGYSTSPLGSTNLTIDSSAEPARIANYLKNLGMSKAGVFGVMGNLRAESGLRPNNMQDSYETKLGYDDDSYTASVDSGAYSANKFINDSVGYGLAQWTYHSRKQQLLELAKRKGTSIANIDTQLEHLGNELESYNKLMEVLRTTNDISQASDMFMTEFERPKDQSQSAKNRRSSYGIDLANTYSKEVFGYGDAPKGYHHSDNYGYGNYSINRTMRNHDNRMRNSGGYGGYDDTNLMSMMAEMLAEMQGTNSGINRFNDKEFGNKNTYVIDGSQNNVNVNQSNKPKEAVKIPSTMVNGKSYEIAKKIASGKLVV